MFLSLLSRVSTLPSVLCHLASSPGKEKIPSSDSFDLSFIHLKYSTPIVDRAGTKSVGSHPYVMTRFCFTTLDGAEFLASKRSWMSVTSSSCYAPAPPPLHSFSLTFSRQQSSTATTNAPSILAMILSRFSIGIILGPFITM